MHKTNSRRYYTMFTEDRPCGNWEAPKKKTMTLALEPGDTVIHQLDEDTRIEVRRDLNGEVHVTKEKRIIVWAPVDED